MSTRWARKIDVLEDEVRKIRELLGARSDSDLADKLGLGRTAVSRWKERGVIPPEYRYLLEMPRDIGIEYAGQFIVHTQVYTSAYNHYWLRAALQMLPAEYGIKLSDADRARLLEFVLTRLIGAAADATIRGLGKSRCESEEDFQSLIEILTSGTDPDSGSSYADRITRVLDEGAPARAAEH